MLIYDPSKYKGLLFPTGDTWHPDIPSAQGGLGHQLSFPFGRCVACYDDLAHSTFGQSCGGNLGRGEIVSKWHGCWRCGCSFDKFMNSGLESLEVFYCLIHPANKKCGPYFFTNKR